MPPGAFMASKVATTKPNSSPLERQRLSGSLNHSQLMAAPKSGAVLFKIAASPVLSCISAYP